MNQGSKIYLEKYLEGFGKKSTVYAAIVEAITSAIEAIEQKEDSSDRNINTHIDRDNILLEESLAEINNINLRIEFITWDKLLRDAKIRHRIFFEKLRIQK